MSDIQNECGDNPFKTVVSLSITWIEKFV